MRPRNRRVIRTDLLRDNMRRIRSIVPESAKVLAVVKADGYGHGAAETARAALEGGQEEIDFGTLGTPEVRDGGH